MSVEEDVQGDHRNDEQCPSHSHIPRWLVCNLLDHSCLLFCLIQQTDDDHRYTNDDEDPEGEHHEVGPEVGAVKHEQIEDTCADAEHRTPREGHVGCPRGGALPENTEEEDGRHWWCDESIYKKNKN